MLHHVCVRFFYELIVQIDLYYLSADTIAHISALMFLQAFSLLNMKTFHQTILSRLPVLVLGIDGLFSLYCETFQRPLTWEHITILLDNKKPQDSSNDCMQSFLKMEELFYPLAFMVCPASVVRTLTCQKSKKSHCLSSIDGHTGKRLQDV